MLADDNIAALRELKLKYMAEALEQQRQNPAIQSMSLDEVMSILIGSELNGRRNWRFMRLRKKANLKVNAVPEEIRYYEDRYLNRKVVKELLTCDWIDHGQNLLITGLAGVGKTWLACAFLEQALRKGISGEYMRLSDLCLQFEVARGIGDLYGCRKRLRNTSLLVIDDLGLTPLSPRSRQDLFEVLDDRYLGGSVIVTSQMPVKKWHDYIADETFADAILDRLIHNSHRIELGGESQRRHSKPDMEYAERSPT